MSIESPSSPTSDISSAIHLNQTTGVQAAAAATTNNNSNEHALKLHDLLMKDLEHVKKVSDELKEYGNSVISEASTMQEVIKKYGLLLRESCIENPAKADVQEKLRKAKKTAMKLKRVVKLKLQIPSKSDANTIQRFNDSAQQTSAFKDVKAIDVKALYDGLSDNQKVCLLCFSVFPQDVIIPKRLMLYWWIGEGFIFPTPGEERTTEQLANEFFNELMEKGFIEPFSESAAWK